jgi:hypothetical protein
MSGKFIWFGSDSARDAVNAEKTPSRRKIKRKSGYRTYVPQEALIATPGFRIFQMLSDQPRNRHTRAP